MKYIKYVFLLLSIIVFQSCGTYSFSGFNPIKAKTFQVNRFENNALLVEPGLEQGFQDALQDLVLDQTNYSLVTSNADLIYEGEIITYGVSPTTATSDNRAAQNRLTIGVKIRFYNTNNEEDNKEKSFSFFYDYPSNSQLVGDQKIKAHEEIFDRLTQDIVNITLSKWES
ncbi:hypothetical protein BFR04_15510 [Gaetbulibacter sp. 4G1]|nr:LptE family protein [Gaetbulibacter sp. 4G1]PIA81103.1 hypothetical protein BFR04_15510 [Gaetbulibacter sp. 4G1]